jgi:predicted metal-dependent hydrolase
MVDLPTIVITGAARWADELPALPGFEVGRLTSPERVAPQLVDMGAVLVLVDGDGDDWESYAAGAKASPATRRIPVFVVVRSGEMTDAPSPTTVDGTITVERLLADPAAFVSEHAALPEPDVTAQLADECGQPLPPLAVQGIEKFNNREFYPQHDLFEELWMDTDGPVRDLYQAILQVGVAYYQIERGNYRGARKIILRGVAMLNKLPDVCQSVDVAGLRADAERVRDALAEITPEEIASFDRSLLRPVRLLD